MPIRAVERAQSSKRAEIAYVEPEIKLGPKIVQKNFALWTEVLRVFPPPNKVYCAPISNFPLPLKF